MTDDTAKKRTKGTGKKKIQMQKIANIKNRRTTFSKRKNGMFKKAVELAEMTGCRVAALVFSPETMTPFLFGNIELIEQAIAAAASTMKLSSEVELSPGDVSTVQCPPLLSTNYCEQSCYFKDQFVTNDEQDKADREELKRLMEEKHKLELYRESLMLSKIAEESIVFGYYH